MLESLDCAMLALGGTLDVVGQVSLRNSSWSPELSLECFEFRPIGAGIINEVLLKRHP